MARKIVDPKTLRSYSPSKPEKVPMSLVLAPDIATSQRADRVWRNRFGRAISMDRIETALISANIGIMKDITDLSRETVDTDPHLASVLNKRMGAVSTLPWEVRPATGIGVNRRKAEYYAEIVQEQLSNLKNFRQTLNRLAWGLFDGRSVLEIQWEEKFNSYPTRASYGSPTMFNTGMGWIHPRRISFGPYRQLIVQDETVGYQGGNFSAVGLEIDTIPYKFVQWTPQRFGEYPEREGLAPRCMYWSFFKRFAARERLILTELYGKPWRIVEVDPDSPASAEDLADVDSHMISMGSSYSIRLPKGTKLNVVQPQRTAGAVHKDVIEESDKQLSKLVVGQTGTTDGVPAGLNSNQANVMQDEQLMILKTDASEMQEIVESQITDPIIGLNYGFQELIHAPIFVLRSDLPADRLAELDRLNKALEAGLEIRRSEAYEVSGFTIPNREEPIVRMDQPPTPALAPVPPAPRPVIVYPKNTSPEAGEQQPPASTASVEQGAGTGTGVSVGSGDIAKIITVDEARKGQGLEPLGGEIGEMTVAEYEKYISSKKKSEEPNDPDNSDGTNEPDGGTGILPPDTSGKPNAEDEGEEELEEEDEEEEIEEELIKASSITATIKKKGNKWVVYSEDGTRSFGEYDSKEEAEQRLEEIEYFKHAQASSVFYHLYETIDDKTVTAILANASANRLFDKHICEGENCYICSTTRQKQPDTQFGNPETILIRGKHEIYRALRKWVDSYKKAVKNDSTIVDIISALSKAENSLDISKYARAYERRMIQSLALGVLDSALEIGESKTEVEARNRHDKSVLHPFIITLASGVLDFSSMRFEDSIRFFRKKDVLSRAKFEQLSALIKQKSFKIAETQSKQLSTLIKDELVKTVDRGDDLVNFSSYIETRVKNAGFIPSKIKAASTQLESLTAPHTDTVFRTNVLNSYSAGRYNHQTEPVVMELRPIWEIYGIDDGATRYYHRESHGKMLYANDSFWQIAYPPFGFECRCRVKSRPPSYSSMVVDGSSIIGLPDQGFISGVGNLI